MKQSIKEKMVFKQPMGIWTWYSVEDLLLLSDSFCESTGIAKDWRYNYQTFFEVIHGDDLFRFIDNIEAILQGANPRWIQYRIINRDNTVKNIDCYLVSLSTEFKDIFDITGVCYEE